VKSGMLWCSVRGTLEQDNLSGVIQIMLRKSDELRECRIWRICNDRLEESFRWKVADCLPKPRIERKERRYIPLPIFVCGRRHRGPVLVRREWSVVPVEPSQNEMIAATQVKDELPAAVRARNRMSHCIRGLYSVEGLAHRRAVPCCALHAATQLVCQRLDDADR
jgi:hypothetical protein